MKIMAMAVSMLCCMAASAFYYDGISYTVVNEEAGYVKVDRNEDYGRERLTIPAEVIYDGRSYSVMLVDEDAFAGCDGVKIVALTNGIRKIADGAFRDCRNLVFIYIPESVTAIGSGILAGDVNLERIRVDDMNRTYCDGQEDCIINVENGVLIQGCKNTEIPDWVTGIGSYAFYGCTGLRSICIPASVRRIGAGAFAKCAALSDIRTERDFAPGTIDETAFHQSGAVLATAYVEEKPVIRHEEYQQKTYAAATTVTDEFLHPNITEPRVWADHTFTATFEGTPVSIMLTEEEFNGYVAGNFSIVGLANDLYYQMSSMIGQGAQEQNQTENSSGRGGWSLMSIVWIVAILCLLCPKDKKTWEKEKKEQAAAYEDRRRSSGNTWSYNGRSFRSEADMLDYKNQYCNP